MEVNGQTRIIGIFGYPIAHTLSPRMHNSAFQSLKLDMCYVPFKVSPEALPDAVMSIRSLNMLGVNITVPHKENAIPLLDKVDEEAAFIGAINTVVNSYGTLTGYNTDGRGFMSALSEENISVSGKKVFIIGAGGASRAISYYLSEQALALSLFDLDIKKADNLISDLKRIRDNVSLHESANEIESFDIIINATPLGLKPDDPLPLDPDLLSKEMVVCDLVYKKTDLLSVAAEKGCRTIDGSGMLLWQGILAFELWTGIKPPVDVMRAALMSGIQ